MPARPSWILAAMSESGCTLCQTTGPLLDWRCPGCRARMLATCPDRITRQRWLTRWRNQGEDAMADAVVAKLKAMARDRNNNHAMSET